ncbi:MAG: DUF3616 domain-containing protein [Deltaproteobacteria bacterium]|nr:DUF3616 domain-containing protein [Deltaproteobacteria bacterium]
MSRTPLVMVALATSLVAGLPAAIPAADLSGLAPTPLRADPDRLCEASAVVAGRDGAAWVVDRAIDDTLFGFSVKAGALVAVKERNLSLSAIPAPMRPHDVEAAAIVIRSLVLVGSHARGASCEVRPERERILVAELDQSGPALREPRAIDDAPLMASLWGADERTCLESLFTPTGRAIDASRALCRTLVAAERAASKDACGTLAIAGAAVVVQGARERLWLGLRAPLVDGKAALIRMANLDALRFDMAALVDLGGSGIRELAGHGRSLFAVAGPAVDGSDPFALYAVTPRSDETFDARRLRGDLIPSSGGLLPADAGLVAIVDGAAGKDGGPCRVPARQYPLKDANVAQ